METHPNKNQILKAIGTDFDLRPEVCKEPMQMKENDILLICSDGLCGMVHDRDIARITYANISNLENATQLLIDEANNNGGKDNITATLVTFGQPQDQKVVMTAAPIQNTESSKNNKKWLLYGGMAVLLLALVAFLVWGRGGKTDQTYCQCYKDLSDKVNNQQTDSLKVSVYDSGVSECEKIEKKDLKCTKKADLEKTIATVKEAVKDKKGASDDEDKGKDDLKNKPETDKQKKEEEAKKKAEDEKKKKEEEAKKKAEQENKTSDDCGKKLPYTPIPGDGYQSVATKNKEKCPGITEATVKDDLEGKELKAGEKIEFTCKCK
jgi:hypothetical protein